MTSMKERASDQIWCNATSAMTCTPSLNTKETPGRNTKDSLKTSLERRGNTKENNENYDWFVGHCKQSGLGEWLDQTDQSIITDRHKGIPHACETFLKSVKHVNCMHHLIDNMRTAGLGTFLTDDIYHVQKAEHAPLFNTRMDALREKNAKVAEYLAKIPADKWAIHAIGTVLFGHRTSNRVESENSR